MDSLTEYSFWCWKPKLQGTIQLLCLLSGYTFSATDVEIISEGLYGTNADKSHWFTYNYSTTRDSCQVSMALDGDNPEIVFLIIRAPREYQERIQFLDLIQSSLKTIEIEA